MGLAPRRHVGLGGSRGYSRSAIEALHAAAGFEPPVFLAEFSREPARGGERIVTTVARRPS
jgi:hypothetical protein